MANTNDNCNCFIKYMEAIRLVGHNTFMELKIQVIDDTLRSIYEEAVKNHNEKIIKKPRYYDSGFDLFLPNDTEFLQGTNKVDFKVKCSGEIIDLRNDTPWYTGYYTYARSSISKTPLRLANNQGIIDAGYRGPIIGMFDLIHQQTSYEAKAGTRLIQICAPNLMPIYVELVSDLGENTSRGTNGIGSTGI